MENHSDLLVEILLDRSARMDERDDAAVDLGEYGGNLVVEALAAVACSRDESDVLVASAGESLAMIWLRNGSIDFPIARSLSPVALAEVKSLLGRRAPHLIPGLNCDNGSAI